LKRFVLLTLSLTAVLTACLDPQHIIERERLLSVKDQVFHVRSVRIGCAGISQVPNLPVSILGCTKDCQLAMLNNIPTQDIVGTLSDSYGIFIAKDQLSLHSEIRNILTAAVSVGSAGRCFSLQGSDLKNEPNVVDIEYTVIHQHLPSSVTVGYKVMVRSSENILIKHEGFIKSFEYDLYTKGNYFNEAMKNITETAAKIPSALERDIKAHQVTSKP
jgi:hypothetical protein